MPADPTPALTDEDDGPECETCGKTTCADADLPGFSEPQACPYLPIYNALRYDRCDYGCGRDITQASIRRDIVPTLDALLAAARADERERLRGVLTEGSDLPELRFGERGPAVWTVTVGEITAALTQSADTKAADR